MKKTKLVIGACLVAMITLLAYQRVENTFNALQIRIDTLEEYNETLLEELNKSKEKIEEQEYMIEDKKQDINTLYEKLQEQDKLLNSTSHNVNYNPQDITAPSNASLVQLKNAVRGTSLEGLEKSFFLAERTYKINSLFMIGLVANESSWGTSHRAKNQNNMTGYAVYTPLSRGGEFPSKSNNILATAKLLSEHYVSSDGKHYKGTSIYSVNDTYCPIGDYSWSNTINSIALDLKNKINN